MHRVLDGADDAEVPIEWWLSRMCEEFHCLPSAALREWEDAPAGLLETILEYRSYAAAKSIVDHAKTRKDIPRTPMCQLAQRIEFDLAKQEIDGRQVHD